MIDRPNEKLSQRERQVLKAIIEDYINSMNPIGSTYLKKQYDFSLSSATLRSTMASLEHKGMLTHPHTSSGRIPTDRGYRYFVDQLISTGEQDLELFIDLHQHLDIVGNNVDDLMRAAAGLLAQISRMVGIVMLGRYKESILKDIELVPLSTDRVLMILAMKSGLIRSISLNLQVAVNPEKLEIVARILKERLIDLTLKQIHQSLKDRLIDTEIYHHEIVQILLNDPEYHFCSPQDTVIYQSTLLPLLEQPEFQDIELFQQTARALDSAAFQEHLTGIIDDPDNHILIGRENQEAGLENCSLITTKFTAAELTGRLVVVGPTRLQYRQILLTLEKLAEILPDVC